MTDEFEVLNNQADDLLSLSNENNSNLSACWPHPIVKVYKLSDKLHEYLMSGLHSQRIFLNEGMPCEFLKLGSPKWRKGRLKVKLVLEFYPDEPESPLDDIREMMKDNPQ
ncbi:MAG: hypothetical protein KME19_25490 [Microcoleus vaginatus WJT46-NPBG5]|jgi:hypothetical protein|nr:hypothetical protein [Microcoleus vaginatus WJT46-NPBG5]